MIEVALNGARLRNENPAIPFTTAEMAESAREAVAAGAACIHYHVRAGDSRESIDSSDVAAALDEMRRAVPDTPIGVSTAEWILPDSIERQRTVAAWTVLPDFVSVNFNEIGAQALAEFLLSRGVGIEAGLGSVLAAEEFLGSGLSARCLRVLIEPEEQDSREAIAVVGYIEAFLERGGVTIPRLLHGYERTAWEFVDLAGARRYDTRIGFEDTVTLPDGTPAPGNGAMIAEAVRRMRRFPAASGSAARSA